jgi:uncharacterized protein (TIGR03067 family)
MKSPCIIAAVVCAAVVSTHAADVAGTWQSEFDTQIGLQKYTFTFKQDGGKITGRANSDIGGEKRAVELKDARLEGDKITFHETFEFQGNAIRIDYQGRVAGEEIRFTRNVGEFATEELVARRVKDAAGAGAAAGAFDASKMPGTWTYFRGERDGNKLAKEHFGGTPVVITDQEIKLKGPDGDFIFAYTLDTTRQPASVKLEMTAGIAVGATADGIIGFDGGRLQLCYAATGGAVPTKFEAPAGSGAHLFVFEPAAAKPEPAK